MFPSPFLLGINKMEDIFKGTANLNISEETLIKIRRSVNKMHTGKEEVGILSNNYTSCSTRLLYMGVL